MSHGATAAVVHAQVVLVMVAMVIVVVVVIVYGVATISRLLKMIGLFCRILSLLWVSFAKETYHFKEPTNRSHRTRHVCEYGTILP